MNDEVNAIAIQAKSDENVRNDLINRYEPFILNAASTTVRHFVTKADDEWSIALIAFSHAIDTYSIDAGGFLYYAKLLIQRKLTDYFRVNSKYNNEISVSTEVLDCNPDEEEVDSQLQKEIAASAIVPVPDKNLADEIEAMEKALGEYGFSFYDLVECSPKQERTKESCAAAIRYLLETPLLINEIRRTHQLTITAIEKSRHIPRKILERHRKYIITVTEILLGDYPGLAEYLKFVKTDKAES